jgi:hypothetical protein
LSQLSRSTARPDCDEMPRQGDGGQRVVGDRQFLRKGRADRIGGRN